MNKKIAAFLISMSLALGSITLPVAMATVSDLDTQTITALGNGVTVNYTIGFTFQDNDDVIVYREEQSSSPYARTLIAQGVGASKFTITGGDPGTTVHMGTAPSATQRLIILRQTPRTQAVNYDETQAFPAEDHEEAMDKMTLLLQEIDANTNKKIGLATSSTYTTPTYPDPVASNIIMWNSGGTDLENKTAAQVMAIAGVCTLTGSETLTNKTLTLPTIDIGLMDGQASSPSNPSAGYYKLYIKDNGELYKLDSGGTEALIPSGTAGNSFQTLTPTAGTAPVADAAADTLTFTSSGSSIVITGTAASDTLNFDVATTLSGMTLTSPTLSSPVMSDPSSGRYWFSEQLVTPATPASGVHKLYFKNDGALYVLDSAGTETAVATGAGSNSFVTIDAPAGTDPVADSVTDTLTITTSDSTIVATGTSGTDTLNLAVGSNLANANLAAGAAITRSKLASGTNYRIVANNSSGVMSENAALTAKNMVIADANGQLTGLAPSATANTSVVSNGTDFASGPIITSGTYTPGLTNGTNITGTPSSNGAQYLRVGNVVTVSGQADIQTTAAANTNSTLGIALPIASNFSAATDGIGISAPDMGTNTANAGHLSADAANDRMTMTWPAQTTGGNTGYYYHFTYQIK